MNRAVRLYTHDWSAYKPGLLPDASAAPHAVILDDRVFIRDPMSPESGDYVEVEAIRAVVVDDESLEATRTSEAPSGL